MPPSYPHPPQTDAPLAARVQVQRKLTRKARRSARGRTTIGSDVPQRILLIRPDHLGDLLFQGPALRSLNSAQTLT